MKRGRRGQSVLEYTVVVAVIIAALLAAAGAFQANVKNKLEKGAGGKLAEQSKLFEDRIAVNKTT